MGVNREILIAGPKTQIYVWGVDYMISAKSGRGGCRGTRKGVWGGGGGGFSGGQTSTICVETRE